MKKILLFIILILFGNAIFGQTTIAIQDFEATPATPTWAFTNVGGGISTATGSTDTPTNQRIRNGSRSFQISNTTSTLDFDNIDISAYSSVSITIRVSSTSASAANGADATDYVRIFTALNNSSFLTDTEINADITLKGTTNARWRYSSTGVATTSGTNVVVAGTGGTNTGTIYSTLTVNIPNGTNFVDLRITALNNDANERWNIDDVQLEGTLAVSNTISAPSTISNVTLANCTATQNINVNVTSTGTFIAGNQYTAQLSDASGSFASPLATASITSTSNSPSAIVLTVPAGTPTGTGYLIRVISNNPSVTGSNSNTFTITQSGSCVTTATDYFRSKQTGNWNVAGNWESSADNTNWITATLVPNDNANIITIQTGHNISMTDARTFDQTVVNGTLTFGTNASPTIADRPSENDLIVNGGGILELNGTANSINITFTGTLFVNSNGTLRYTVGLNGGSVAQNLGGTSTNTKVIYANGAIFEWNNTGGFGSSNVTYFSTSVTADIPVFRITQVVASVGAGSPNDLNINGVFEANSNITFVSSGTKFFRNGIRGTGTINQQASSGKLVINGAGTNTELSGVTLALDGTNGMTLENNGIVKVNSNITLTSGLFRLVNADLDLNGRDFNVNGGTIQEDLPNNFTILDNTATTEANKGGAINYSATVTNTATNFFGLGLLLNHNGTGDYVVSVKRLHYSSGFGSGVKRLYSITGTASGQSTITINYASSELGTVAEPLNISRWQSGLGWANYTPNTQVNVGNRSVTYNNVTGFSTWTLSGANTSLPVSLLSFEARQQSENETILTWATAIEINHKRFEIWKSINGFDYSLLFTKDGQSNSNQIKNYNFIDNQFNQSAYYQLKQTDNDGKINDLGIKFVNKKQAINIEIYPNPITEKVYVRNQTEDVSMIIFDNIGKKITDINNINNLQNEFDKLSKGVYLVVFKTKNGSKTQTIIKN